MTETTGIQSVQHVTGMRLIASTGALLWFGIEHNDISRYSIVIINILLRMPVGTGTQPVIVFNVEPQRCTLLAIGLYRYASL